MIIFHMFPVKLVAMQSPSAATATLYMNLPWGTDFLRLLTPTLVIVRTMLNNMPCGESSNSEGGTHDSLSSDQNRRNQQ